VLWLKSSPYYPTLSHLGLSQELLLAVADDSCSVDAIKVLHIPKSYVTNQTMSELHNFLYRNPLCSYYTYWQWAFALLENSRPDNNFPTIKSIRQSIVRLSSKLTKLRKMPSSEEKCLKLAEFFNQEYELPNVF
jgi:hypothetical protein